jgi:CRP-like cAMP-binding protein
MKNVGSRVNILRVSDDLKSSLETLGCRQNHPAAHVLFHEDEDSGGVYLVCKGKVRMSVRTLPELDRDFAAGSLLGLPSTFTGHPYSLSAVTLTQSDVVHVPPIEFLALMRERPGLCKEATEILGREVTFIQAALAERRRHFATAS